MMTGLNEELWNRLLPKIDDIETVYEEAFDWLTEVSEVDLLVAYRPDPLEDLSTGNAERAIPIILKGDCAKPNPVEIDKIRTNQSGMVELSHELVHLTIDNEWFGALESDEPINETIHTNLLPLAQFLQFTARYHYHRDRAGISEWFLKIGGYLSEGREFHELIKALLDLACEAMEHDTGGFYTVEENQLQLQVSSGFDVEEHRGRRAINEELLLEKGMGTKNLLFEKVEKTNLFNLYLPLRMGPELIGVIALFDLPMGPEELPEADEFSLTALATVSAIALNNLELSSQLQEKVIHDELSGLKTNEYFRERVHQEIERGQRYDIPSSLLLIDLDHFEEINEKHGYPVGDAVLREVGRVIRNTVRRIDICSRVENDQFGILFPSTTIQDALNACDRLQEILNSPLIDIRGQNIEVDFSGGLAGFPEDADNVEELFRQVELALYEAKQTGKNRIVTAKGTTEE